MDDQIDFDFNLAEVEAEVSAEATAQMEQTADLNAYYKDLLNYVFEDRGYVGTYSTVTTADKWMIEMVRVHKQDESESVLNSKKQLFFLDAINSDCSYWAHHDMIYQLAESGYDIWLGNTRFSTSFSISPYNYGGLNEVAVHDVPS